MPKNRLHTRTDEHGCGRKRENENKACLSLYKLPIGKSEILEYLLVDGREQILVGRRQLRLLHREVSVKVAHVVRAFLKVRFTNEC